MSASFQNPKEIVEGEFGNVVNSLGLGDIDENQFQDMDDDIDIVLYIRDDGEDGMPSVKHGLWLELSVYLCCVLVGLVLVGLVLYCSRNQEKTKTNSEEVKETEQKKSFRSNLSLRPWSDGFAWTMDPTTEMSLGSMNDFTADKSDSVSLACSTDSDNSETFVTLENCCKAGICGTSESNTVCELCTEEFEMGQPVYESNNPQCRHVFHMVCMDKWLNIQNSCPVCNQPYVLQTV